MDNTRPTVTVKLKPYLQDYLRGRLNDKLSADSRNIIGVLLKPFIEYIPRDATPTFPESNEYITFELPYYDKLNTRNGTVYVNEENQVNFQRSLECFFKELFFQYVDDKVRYDLVIDGKNVRRGQIKKIILQFCADYNINFDNLTYDLLQKSYYRRRQKMGLTTNLFSRIVSLTCPLIFLTA
ncbi:MAG: hypothetical protein IH597_15030 [Bacteroidales bacterium]|nr:hypothetical protein [Bacteroidales bacterium]